MSEETLFWADRVAAEIDRAHRNFTVATGITPSGEIHIGNMREVVTADAVVRALKDRGHKPEFCYIADTYDPLRRVYPFLDQKTYQDHVGKPLSEIPGPKGDGVTYAEHFLKPFLESLDKLDIQVKIHRADRLYKEGKYTRNITRALEKTNQIRKILKEETGKDTPDDWSPFNPICGKCARMTTTKVVGFNPDAKTVDCRCECGFDGPVSMAGGGKLTWRVDWPARWEILGVTVEPFGKDHASKGGSYDSGVRIAREIFEYEPPFPIVYEWISLRGGGDMSSSKGNVIPIHQMIETVPPDVLKYAVIKQRPNRRIVFDPGLPILTLMDEYDDPDSKSRVERAAEISRISTSEPIGIPFRHIVSLVQICSGNIEQLIQVLERTGYAVKDKEAVASRAQYAQRWLEKFAPEEVKFALQETLPEQTRELSPDQKKALVKLGKDLRDGMTAEEIHQLIYSVKEELGVAPAQIFQAIYVALLGKQRGPRAGFFLASLESDFVKRRFGEISTD